MNKLYTALAGVLALAAMGTATGAAAAYKCVVIHRTDGTTQQVTMSDNLRLSCTADCLSATDFGTEVQVPRDQVASWEYTTPTGIDAIGNDANTDGITAASDGVTVTVSGLQAGASVSLFDMAGRQVAASTASQEGVAAISLSGLPVGTYALSTQSSSMKILVR